MRGSVRVLGLTAALVLAGSQWASAQVDGEVWRGTVDDGDVLEVKGINGAISVTLASGSEISVSAQAESRRSALETVYVEVVEHEGGVTLCAMYPTPAGARENSCEPGREGRMNTGRNDVRIDFVVELPEGVRFRGKTVNGDVDALGLASDLSLTTVNGDVDVSTSGFAEASTVNGSIEAAMAGSTLTDGLDFNTVNGDIVLDVADDLDADLDARWVNGGLDSDLPLTLNGRVSRGRARGTLGDGGPRLSVATVNGSIRVR